jgi:5-methylthioadenosine/S-adenosylhomocysteine deaminase
VGGGGAPAPATGLRAVVYLEVFGRDASALERFEELRERVEPALSDLVRLGISPHAPYTCTLELYEACAALGVPVATHLAESVSERQYLLDGSGDWSAFSELLVPPPGTTGIRLLAEAGLLSASMLAAHCVDVDDEELGLLARSRIGVAPLCDLLDAGVTVGIATDSPASAPSFDLFEEARTAIVCARARAGRPDALSAALALELVTLGGARVLGIDSEVGSLVPGKRADVAVVSLAGSPFDPVEDPAAAVILGGSPDRVAATLVHGEDRYRRGTSAWPDSRRAARRARSRMLR